MLMKPINQTNRLNHISLIKTLFGVVEKTEINP